MSIDEMATHLGVAKSTLYYYMRKFCVERRSKGDAQRRHLEKAPHQRTGKVHTDVTKERIATGTKEFWESKKGSAQKKRLGALRRAEWKERSPKQRTNVLNRLQSAARPEPGHLSKFGSKLAAFLGQHEEVKTGIKLTANHISDIILETQKVVVELVLPISVYGEEQEQKFSARYDRIIAELNDAGYRVMIVEDKSNSLSRARCQRIYDELLKFFQDKSLQRLTIVS